MMRRAVKLQAPFTEAAVRQLKAGQLVCLSGRIITGRDRALRFLLGGGRSPVDLKNAAIYHCGPIAVWKDGRWTIVAAGPTTSARMESCMSKLIERHHLRVVIGKGGMNDGTRKACKRHGCVYLEAVGGAGVVAAASITEVPAVHFLKEFGHADAMWELVVKDLKTVVAMDAAGRDLHRRVRASSKRRLSSLLDTR